MCSLNMAYKKTKELFQSSANKQINIGVYYSSCSDQGRMKCVKRNCKVVEIPIENTGGVQILPGTVREKT